MSPLNGSDTVYHWFSLSRECIYCTLTKSSGYILEAICDACDSTENTTSSNCFLGLHPDSNQKLAAESAPSEDISPAKRK